MGRRGYPAEFRQRVLDLVAAGRRVEDIARDLGISDQTVYSWRRQDRIDRGLESGHPARITVGSLGAARDIRPGSSRTGWRTKCSLRTRTRGSLVMHDDAINRHGSTSD